MKTVKINLEDKSYLPDDYHIYTDSTDYGTIDDLFEYILKISTTQKIYLHHILLRDFNTLHYFPSYEERFKVTGELLTDVEVKHYHPLSEKIDWKRVVLFFSKDMSIKDYERVVIDNLKDPQLRGAL